MGDIVMELLLAIIIGTTIVAVTFGLFLRFPEEAMGCVFLLLLIIVGAIVGVGLFELIGIHIYIPRNL